MGHHHNRKLAAQFAVRHKIFPPHFLPALLYHWHIVVAVKIALSQAGKMFAAAQDFG